MKEKQYKYQNHRILAHKFMEEENLEKAREQFEIIVSRQPQQMEEEDFIDLGLIYIETECYEEAARIYAKLMFWYPESAQGYYGLALIEEEKGNMDLAIDYYLKAIEVEPDYLDACFFLAALYDDMEMSEKAIYWYKYLLDLEPEHFWGNLNLGAVYEGMDDLEEASFYFDRAQSIEEHYLVYFNQGVLAKRQNHAMDAIHAYHKSLELDSTYVYTYINLAVLYREMGAFQDVESILLQGIKCANHAYLLEYHLACLYSCIEQPEEVMHHIEKALLAHPSFIEQVRTDEDLVPYVDKIELWLENWKRAT